MLSSVSVSRYSIPKAGARIDLLFHGALISSAPMSVKGAIGETGTLKKVSGDGFDSAPK